jgi:hypothetical protein
MKAWKWTNEGKAWRLGERESDQGQMGGRNGYDHTDHVDGIKTFILTPSVMVTREGF